MLLRISGLMNHSTLTIAPRILYKLWASNSSNAVEIENDTILSCCILFFSHSFPESLYAVSGEEKQLHGRGPVCYVGSGWRTHEKPNKVNLTRDQFQVLKPLDRPKVDIFKCIHQFWIKSKCDKCSCQPSRPEKVSASATTDARWIDVLYSVHNRFIAVKSTPATTWTARISSVRPAGCCSWSSLCVTSVPVRFQSHRRSVQVKQSA